MISLVLLVAAFVLFVLSTISIPSPARFQWLPAGLAALTLSMMLAGLRL